MKIEMSATEEASPVTATSSASPSSHNEVKAASAARVQALREAVKDGSFKPNPVAIADKIIATELNS